MDLQPIKTLLENQAPALSIEFYPRPGDPRSDMLEAFLDRISRAGLPFATRKTEGIRESDLPAFSLGSQGSFRHFYQAVPEGLEWPPFVTLVKILAGGQSGLKQNTLTILKKSPASLQLKVLITLSCPFCPRMVELAHRLAAASPSLQTRVVDTLLFPEWVQRYRLKAAPTTVLGEEVFLTGIHGETELADWIARLSSEDFLLQLYRNELLEKRLSEAIERLRLHPENLPLAARLLKAEEFGIRLGAMALFEELIDAEHSLHSRILDALAPLLIGSADPIIGDTAFLIGRIRDPRKGEVLKGLLNHPNSEIVEIAREGLSPE